MPFVKNGDIIQIEDKTELRSFAKLRFVVGL